MKSGSLTIASTANECYAVGLGVMMCSAVMCSGGRSITFHVVDDGIAENTRLLLVDRVRSVAAEQGITVVIRFIDFSRIVLPPLIPLHGSMAAYGRMFLPDLLGDDSVFYVDADIICNRGFPDAADMALQFPGALLAGCAIPGKALASDCPWLEGIADNGSEDPYFNTGFLWMNLAGLREFDLQEKFRCLANLGKPMRYADQTALNFLCRGRIGTLPAEFNHLWNKSPGLKPDARVNVHFVGPAKPWHAGLSGETALEIALFNVAASRFRISCGNIPARRMRNCTWAHAIQGLLRVICYKITFNRRSKKAQANLKRQRLMGCYIRSYEAQLRRASPSPPLNEQS